MNIGNKKGDGPSYNTMFVRSCASPNLAKGGTSQSPKPLSL